jgi:hypothetical protein
MCSAPRVDKDIAGFGFGRRLPQATTRDLFPTLRAILKTQRTSRSLAREVVSNSTRVESNRR